MAVAGESVFVFQCERIGFLLELKPHFKLSALFCFVRNVNNNFDHNLLLKLKYKVCFFIEK